MAVVYAATPLAIRVADRLEFYDRPVGYKAHGSPTPYLGGAAVIAGFLVAVMALAGAWERTLPLLGGVVAMWAIGTWDDRRTVRPLVRVTLEVAIAATLWQLGLGWELGAGAAVDLAVTAFWIVAVVNAFNLFDNMDGATPSMGTVAAAGLSVLGIAQGNTWLAVTAAALCGACAGFLPHNLRSPARIFLGDGGSMPIGFAIAALTMIGVSESAVEWQSLAMGLLFVGVPALDTTLVMISRRRRGVSLLTGGRDHLTHRAHQRLLTARAVAIALGSAQATTSALAIVALRGGSSAIVAAVCVYIVGAAIVIAVLDSRWAPAEVPPAAAGSAPAARRLRARRRGLTVAAVVVLIATLSISPFFRGYYDSAIWAPAGLALVVLLTAGVIGRPPRISRPAMLVLAGVTGLAVLSLASALWADSIQQAVASGNRWLVYAALTGLLLVVIRTETAATWAMGTMGAVVLIEAVVALVRMSGADGPELFLAGRLDEPLGYINGQAAYHLLGLWCLLAVAEQRRWPLLAGAGMAGTVVLAAMLLLAQSRGIVLATATSVLVVLAVVPGRARRAWALLAVAVAITAAAPALLDVYSSGRESRPDPATVDSAVRAAVVAAAAAGVIWALACFAAARVAWPQTRVRAGTVAVFGALGLAAVGIGVAERTAVTDELSRQYDAFTRVGDTPAADESSTRLTSGSGNRYDYWRIAVRAWQGRPALGVGAGNYDGPYFARRTTAEDVRQPHSIELQALSELGLVGAALLALVVAGLAWGAGGIAAAARSSRAARFQAVAAVGCVAAWLSHTSVDWLHLLPGVTGMALVAAVVLVRVRDPLPAPTAARPASRSGLVLAVAASVVLAATGLTLSRQWLAERYQRQAEAALAARPADALRLADRSLRLDREAVGAYYVKAAALARFEEARAARAALEEAARREPGDFVTWALLGDLATRTGDRVQARRDYRRALRLNPRDRALKRHLEQVGG